MDTITATDCCRVCGGTGVEMYADDWGPDVPCAACRERREARVNTPPAGATLQCQQCDATIPFDGQPGTCPVCAGIVFSMSGLV